MPADSGKDQSALASAADMPEPSLDIWAAPDTVLPRHLASWDPVIAGLIARAGDEQARAAVEQHLAERMQSAEWARLARTLLTLLDGPNGPGLLDGLGKIDAAITARALAALRGDVQVPSQLWPAASPRSRPPW
jgi:hypothetical protein